MAADEGGEKTEQPTARRMQEAREGGQIAKSPDLTAALALLGGLLLLKAFGPDMFEIMLASTRDLGQPTSVSGGDAATLLARAIRATAEMLWPFLASLLLVTLVGSFVQSGLVLAWTKITPSLENLSLSKGVKRLFSKDAITRLLMGLVKTVVVAAVAYFTITPRIPLLLAAGAAPIRGVFHMATELIITLATRLALLLLILGLLDYFYQRWSLGQALKMSKQQVKDEMKRMEGDPVMRQRRRQVQAKLAMQRIRMDVPKADVVVTNPTEYAVAVQYEEASMAAPRVLAKGKDLMALHIRQVAAQHGVPIVQRPPLARALFAACEVGDEIPPEYYRAVAEVLAYVYRLESMTRKAS